MKVLNRILLKAILYSAITVGCGLTVVWITSTYIIAKKITLKMESPTATSAKGNKGKGDYSGYNPEPLEADSIQFFHWAPGISFSGYDKPYNSNRETFLITNDSPQHVSAIEVRLTYRDLQGRMLHSRDEKITIAIPPGETRQTSIKSFDTQSTYYYTKSRPPRNGGQPFEVSIIPIKLFIPR